MATMFHSIKNAILDRTNRSRDEEEKIERKEHDVVVSEEEIRGEEAGPAEGLPPPPMPQPRHSDFVQHPTPTPAPSSASEEGDTGSDRSFDYSGQQEQLGRPWQFTQCEVSNC